ncbi:hypothetical protein BRCON_1047 [Candidatus Sumerlaea chitinivorans]|uniref:Uncharacterized protein n=1 Tax=Sumerlaea chitinivorans TaxID=2250252 RepID=A0A2Z4Y3W8_SUMC1|nr:hypothetical protein BRCON_1047 [Candidatus Sumerlaea chitinivorans]
MPHRKRIGKCRYQQMPVWPNRIKQCVNHSVWPPIHRPETLKRTVENHSIPLLNSNFCKCVRKLLPG